VGRGIDEFMWGWQPHFRIDLQVTVERALEAVGAQLDPQAFLVGFAVDPDRARHPVCVEPEDGAFRSSELRGIADRAEEIYEVDPERRIFNTDPGYHERRHAWLRGRARGQAIAEAAEASGAFPGKRVYVNSAGLVEGFEVHSCLAVDSASVDGLPRLEGEEINRFPAPSSFIGELIKLVTLQMQVDVQGVVLWMHEQQPAVCGRTLIRPDGDLTQRIARMEVREVPSPKEAAAGEVLCRLQCEVT